MSSQYITDKNLIKIGMHSECSRRPVMQRREAKQSKKKVLINLPNGIVRFFIRVLPIFNHVLWSFYRRRNFVSFLRSATTRSSWGEGLENAISTKSFSVESEHNTEHKKQLNRNRPIANASSS